MLLIHVREGRALVWDAEGASRLPRPPALWGRPVGSLARQPRQNTQLGLPLSLLPEEARLLAEEGLALLVRAPGVEQAGVRGGGEKEEEEEKLRRSHTEQRRLALCQRRKELEALDQHIRKGRQLKNRRRPQGDLQEPCEGEEGTEKGVKEAEEGEPPATPGPLKELAELEETFNFPLESCLVQLHTACPHPRSLQPLDWRLPSPDWPYPGLESHQLRYAVFRDLRARGYYLTAGGKFGGDFLVYPGDPLRFHAHYIALCVPYGQQLPLQETVTAGRLGSNVKKTVLLCSVAEGGQVVYTSLRWSGIQ
ncbi:tRNA-splicing endonuclease subunit Sen34 [Mobula birostris]|uniref:tRNA-splicing endonuclease subunit Sen34 n=1 Tax=Mobula birostris TaxID=1983395 RepID=UPI003B289309